MHRCCNARTVRHGIPDAPITAARSSVPWPPPACPRWCPTPSGTVSITRALQRGLSPRLVADAHDTSLMMLERNYAKYIADHSDAALRTAQIDLTPTTTDPVVVPLASRRP